MFGIVIPTPIQSNKFEVRCKIIGWIVIFLYFSFAFWWFFYMKDWTLRLEDGENS